MSTNLPDLAALAEHAEAELPVTLRQRYVTARRRGALVLIGRLLSTCGMTWQSLWRNLDVIYSAPFAQTCEQLPEPAAFASADLLRLVEQIERAKPWSEGSSAPGFMATLRGLAAEGATATLSPRQVAWLDLLAEKAKASGPENLPTVVPEGANFVPFPISRRVH